MARCRWAYTAYLIGKQLLRRNSFPDIWKGHDDAVAAADQASLSTPISRRDTPPAGSSAPPSAGTGGEREPTSSDRSLEIQPEQELAPSRKAMLLVSLGRPAEALAWAERSTAPMDRLWTTAIAAHALGRAKESRYALDWLIADHAEGAAYQVALAFASRGEREKAFEWLERAYVQHDSGLLFVKTDPMLRSLHGDPRFAALVRKVGLPMP